MIKRSLFRIEPKFTLENTQLETIRQEIEPHQDKSKSKEGEEKAVWKFSFLDLKRWLG